MTVGPQSGEDDAKALARAMALIGRVLSERYRILELVGRGAMGAVYRGEHLLMHKDVAIKVLHPDVEDFPELVARFQNEAVAGAHISHPNVASASDFGKFDGDSYFLVLEFIRGKTLRDAIAEGPMPVHRAIRIAHQIAEALAAAHDKGIVHRDLKPRNVMLVDNTNDTVKLIDFGFARVPVDRLRRPTEEDAEQRQALTTAGVVFGTMGYVAPEIVFGMDAVKERADLYVLGVMLYEMLAGKPPFEGEDPRRLLAAHRYDKVPAIAERNPEVSVPPAVEAVVMRLLAKEPEGRYDTARDVANALVDSTREFGRNPASLFPPPLPSGQSPAADRAEWGPAGDQVVDLPGHAAQPAGAPVLGEVTSTAALAAEERAEEERAEEAEDARAARAARARARRRLRVSAQILVAIAIAAWVVAFGLRWWEKQERAQSAAPPAEATVAAAVETSAPAATAPIASVKATAETVTASASASASATAAPEATGEPAAQGAEGSDASLELRQRFLKLAEGQDAVAAAKAMFALAEADPDAFKDLEVRRAAADNTVQLDLRGSDLANKAYYVLTFRLGSAGLDVLYAIIERGKSSRSVTRATTILKQPDVLNRTSAALKVAFELRRSSCKYKRMLLDRAVKEGDERTLVLLEMVRSPGCDATGCCIRNHAPLEEAVRKLREKTP